MQPITFPFKQLNLAALKQELLAAGVPPWDGPLKPFYADKEYITLSLPEGSDMGVAAQVIDAHEDSRTPEQVVRDRAKELIQAQTAQALLDRAKEVLTMQSVQAVMLKFNGLLGELQALHGNSLSTTPFTLRQWQELEEAAAGLIDNPPPLN